MKNEIMIGADAIAMFCRLQMNFKKDMPIRSSEMGVLIFIQKQNSDVTPLMISNFFNIAKPSVTSTLNALIKKEYIEKIPSAKDRRSYTVNLTNKGKQLVESTHKEHFKLMDILVEKMGYDDFNKFINLIQKANSILSEGNRR
ncbi:MAG: transcriptional regulator, MarR family [Bacillales bacterium]|jgi:DNA-binding MarR family transcriptional regulator|nr:transcriptional regulator, MarR family [Bacillales bacterium]